VKVLILKNVYLKNIKSLNFLCRNNSANIATGYGLNDRGFGIQFSVDRIGSSPQRPDYFGALSGILSNAYLRTFSPGVKRSGHVAGHSTPYITEAQNVCVELYLHIYLKSSWHHIIKHKSISCAMT
jgi:hypothetical protein